MTEVPEHFYTQSAVLPYRILEGRVEILLVSSRRKKRWVLPKGVVEPGLSAVDSAVKEAWEEAGLEGLAAPQTVGTYRYEKWGGVCTVQVFPLQVERLSESCPKALVIVVGSHGRGSSHSPGARTEATHDPVRREPSGR